MISGEKLVLFTAFDQDTNSSITTEGLAGNISGIVATEKSDQRCDLLRFGDAIDIFPTGNSGLHANRAIAALSFARSSTGSNER